MENQKLCVILLLAIIMAGLADARGRPSRIKTKKDRKFGACRANDVTENITALWQKVNTMTHPIEVHVHDGAHGSHHHHSHSHGKNKTKGNGHGHQNDQHIHIHLTLGDKKEEHSHHHKIKEEYTYARCDMMGHKKIAGSIMMRMWPWQKMQTKVRLSGFPGPSAGMINGVHDYFFDVHDTSDFTNGCDSFGSHDHDHDHDHGDKKGKGGHRHRRHAHGHHGHHSHSSHHSHRSHKSHSSHHSHKSHSHSSHHSHKSHSHSHDHKKEDHPNQSEGWGNVVIDKNGVSRMDLNSTWPKLLGKYESFGRGVVLHDKNDKNICCCVIAHANLNDEDWEKL